MAGVYQISGRRVPGGFPSSSRPIAPDSRIQRRYLTERRAARRPGLRYSFDTIHHMLNRDKPLQGKAVFITGGARRLGRAIAVAMAEAGTDVAITYRNSARDARRT